ncbi:protein LOW PHOTOSYNTHETIC EFFICIENCY 1, chloroplastic-like [Gastrolobium bilobum]|uniref:protein LOW PHOTOSYNTHETIC EFFICIENCY 1, chloroplastic-like n=1 Tax=Gastrolobium bilobum TaxID=150636 RepID=UPI002AB05F02|nr:protein LOW PHOTOSYNTHETIC EFFICIENCY 1, chloroplastic-like [Gastrolobium bilobum]XP_061341863.1 protein LOW PHOTOSYNTHETIC EFFICIENCY 1, chloroplastic-like [Gastrolobium bilobum]
MIHTLSTFPFKGNQLVVPPVPVGFEIGSSCVPDLNRRRRMKLGFVFSISHSTSVGVFQCSRSSRGYGNVICSGTPNFDLRCGFLLGYSELKFVTFFKPNKSHVGDLVPPLGWALEEQEAIGDEVVEEKADSTDNTSINGELEGMSSLNLDQVQDSYSEHKMLGDDDNRKEDEEEEYSSKLDVRALAMSLQTAKTVEDVEEILKDKGNLPLQVYSSVIKGFGKDKRMDSALILFDWMKKRKIETNGSFGPNLFIYNGLLGVVKQSEQFAETEAILNEMAQDGITYNVVTFNTLMAIYVEKGEADKALNMLDEIHRNGLTPSPVSYSQALLAYRRMRDGYGALNFFVNLREKYRQGKMGKDGDGEDWEKEFIKLEKFTIRICYQVLRCWLISRDNLSNNVLKFLVDMDNAGIPLRHAELERLVWACTREDHYSVAKELYSRIRERYDKISLSVCNHVIWLMGKAKKWWAALEIYEDLLDKGPKPNNLSHELIMSHFGFLLSAAKRKGIWRWGVRLLNKMEDKGLKPGSKEWNAVLVACSKASETTAAVQIFKRMVENGEKPNVISYGALLSALEKGKLYDDALRVWDHMVKVGVEPNIYAYTTLASIHTAQGNFSRVDAIIQEMVSLGIEITVVTYNAIISGCARNGMSSAAYEWFHRMKVQNISPNEITYEMLIEALTNDGKPMLAYELYLRARNEGLILSSKAYDGVVQSSHANGATIDLGVLGPRPADKKKKVQIRKTLTEFYNLADVPRGTEPFDRREIYYSKTRESQ